MGVDVTANFVRVVFLLNSNTVGRSTNQTAASVSKSSSSVPQDEEEVLISSKCSTSPLKFPASPPKNLPHGRCMRPSYKFGSTSTSKVCCAHGNAKAFVDLVLSGELPAVEFKRLDGMSSASGLPEDLLFRRDDARKPSGHFSSTTPSKAVGINADYHGKRRTDEHGVEGFEYMERNSQPLSINQMEVSCEPVRGAKSDNSSGPSLPSLTEIYFWGLLFEDAVAVIDQVTRERAPFLHCGARGHIPPGKGAAY